MPEDETGKMPVPPRFPFQPPGQTTFRSCTGSDYGAVSI